VTTLTPARRLFKGSTRSLVLAVLGAVLGLGGGQASAATDGTLVRIGVGEQDAAVDVRVGGLATMGGMSLALTERGASIRLAGPAITSRAFASAWLARAMAAEMEAAGLRPAVWAEVAGYRAAGGPFREPAQADQEVSAGRLAGLPVERGAVPDGRPEAAGLEVFTAEGRSSGVVSGPIEVVRSADTELRVNGRRYRGDFTVIRGPQGLLSGVNRLPLEQYLRGVVAEEMPSSWPIEALKAQAVAARTYALANLGGFEKYGYDLSATTKSQAYGGRDSERASSDAAVDGTRALVATYDGRLISTYYHAHAGGRTDSAADIWGLDRPYLRGVAQTYERPYPWMVVYTRRSLERLIDKLLPEATGQAGAAVGRLLRLTSGRPTPGGRSRDVTVVGTNGRYTIAGERLRGAVGATRMKSLKFDLRAWPERAFLGLTGVAPRTKASRFAVRVGGVPTILALTGIGQVFLPGPAASQTPGLFVIEGQGYGHGVGLSQWGAHEMATRGFTFESILTHFYQGVKVGPYRPVR
jgi:SpoIID/LytB domain protein